MSGLFEEVQARTRELTESLEYQTATSEVLNVISRSPSNIQPVLEAIAETAQRLCRSEHVFIMRLESGSIIWRQLRCVGSTDGRFNPATRFRQTVAP